MLFFFFFFFYRDRARILKGERVNVKFRRRKIILKRLCDARCLDNFMNFNANVSNIIILSERENKIDKYG